MNSPLVVADDPKEDYNLVVAGTGFGLAWYTLPQSKALAIEIFDSAVNEGACVRPRISSIRPDGRLLQNTRGVEHLTQSCACL